MFSLCSHYGCRDCGWQPDPDRRMDPDNQAGAHTTDARHVTWSSTYAMPCPLCSPATVPSVATVVASGVTAPTEPKEDPVSDPTPTIDVAEAETPPESRPARAIFEELLTVEARMGGLASRGGVLRAELAEKMKAAYRAEGVAPTYRAKGLGTVSLPVKDAAVKVSDEPAFMSWLAQRHASEVVGTIEGVPADLLPVILEMLDEYSARENQGAVVYTGSSLALRNPKWRDEFLQGCTPVDDGAVFAPKTGEVVEGVALVPGSIGSVSVRLDPEAKARAAAELADPVAAGMLAAPLGELITPERALLLRVGIEREAAGHDVVPGDAEPDWEGDRVPDPEYFNPDGTFRSPELAARHAIEVQGGFSTPAIEAERMAADEAKALAASGTVNVAPVVVVGEPDEEGLASVAVLASEGVSPDRPTRPEGGWGTLTVPKLQEALIAWGMGSSGKKADLVRRLEEREAEVASLVAP